MSNLSNRLLAELVKEEATSIHNQGILMQQNEVEIRQNYLSEELQVGIQQEIHNPQFRPQQLTDFSSSHGGYATSVTHPNVYRYY
jgi:hypothetical protein